MNRTESGERYGSRHARRHTHEFPEDEGNAEHEADEADEADEEVQEEAAAGSFPQLDQRMRSAGPPALSLGGDQRGFRGGVEPGDHI